MRFTVAKLFCNHCGHMQLCSEEWNRKEPMFFNLPAFFFVVGAVIRFL
jgi:hypothetical protein